MKNILVEQKASEVAMILITFEGIIMASSSKKLYEKKFRKDDSSVIFNKRDKAKA